MSLNKCKIIYLLIILFSFFSCEAQRKCTNCGAVLFKHRMLDNRTNTFVVPAYEKDRKVWYKDSLVIGEGLHVNITQDKNGKETWENFVGEYTFIDLRTKSFYEYLTFSDTAKIVDKYPQPDTGKNKRGWKFFSTQSYFSLNNLENISDTIMNGIIYKRIRSSKVVEVQNPEEQKLLGEKQLLIQIGYIRCDKKNSIFSMDKYLEKKIGCPVLRFDQLAPGNNSWMVTEIEFLPGKLSPKELKVFDAWEKNEKKYPVKK